MANPPHEPEPVRLLRNLLWFTLAALPLGSHAIEEPADVVIRTLDAVEVRQYAPHTAAEVVLNATADAAGNQAFPILARYNAPFTPWFLRLNDIWLAVR